MAVLPQLQHADAYVPCDWDLRADAEGRAFWLDLFSQQMKDMAAAAVGAGYDAATAHDANDAFQRVIGQLRADPGALGPRLDILTLDRARDGAFRDRGIADPYRDIKARENAAALRELPLRLSQLDALPAEHRLEELIRGVFAGNLFDMGAKQVADRYATAGAPPTFADDLAGVKPRPWGVDHLDDADADAVTNAVMFVDNAGADVVLGMLPLARELVRRGASVLIGANESPSLNDITAKELRALLEDEPVFGPLLVEGAIRVMSTGSADPLIDLTALDAAFCDAAAGADLVILEGMGRTLESNWLASFSCAAWRLAMVKNDRIAQRKGLALFDGVFRVTAPGA